MTFPTGSIHKDSPAAKFLLQRGAVDSTGGTSIPMVVVIARGAFATIRIDNKLLKREVGPQIDSHSRYKAAGQDTIILAGADYGSGSSPDWAAKVHVTGADIRDNADTLGLAGHERYTINLPSKIREIRPGQDFTFTTETGKSSTWMPSLDSYRKRKGGRFFQAFRIMTTGFMYTNVSHFHENLPAGGIGIL
ncbi:hypothetical protein REPUB_Repub18cG0017900 [Reevesia pubescens]